ncbi:MAG: hypothetical protein ACPLSY_03525 [Moorellaceae bacterium]
MVWHYIAWNGKVEARSEAGITEPVRAVPSIRGGERFIPESAPDDVLFCVIWNGNKYRPWGWATRDEIPALCRVYGRADIIAPDFAQLG